MRLHPIVILAVGFFLVFLGYNAPQQFMLVVFEKSGQGERAQQALILLYVVIAIAGVILPRYAHKLGTVRRKMVVATITYVLFVIAVYFGGTLTMLGAAVVLGFGGTLLWATMNQGVLRYGSKWQGRGFAVINVAVATAIALGAKLFQWSFDVFGQETFLLFGGIAGTAIAAFAFLPSEHTEDRKAIEGDTHERGYGWGLAVSLLAIYCCNTIWGGCINGALMLYGDRQFGASFVNVVALTPLINCAAALFGGWLSDCVGRRFALMLSAVWYACAGVALALSHDTLTTYCVCACVVSAAHGSLYAAASGCMKLLQQRVQQRACFGLSTAGALAIAGMFSVSRMPVEFTFGILVVAGIVSAAIASIIYGVVKEQ